MLNTDLSKLIAKLLDSADQAGCTPDLVVVDAKVLTQISEVVGHSFEAEPDEDEHVNLDASTLTL